jgi:3-deoxy-D-manno-octulosonic-acid transferase
MIVDLLYELANRTAGPALAVAAPFHGKLRQASQGRRRAVPILTHWARGARDESRPLIWLHAPSVGEALMAQAIISELRMVEPRAQVVFTHFSPSAERVAARLGADVAAYLPWDTRGSAARVMELLQPAVLGFVRTEIWPAHMRAAARLGGRTALVNAVIAEGSSRLRGPARRLLSPFYAMLDAVGAVGEQDARRLPRLGVAAARITVTGDARFDQVYARIAGIDRTSPLLTRLGSTLTVVAGSTWPADEAILLPACQSLLEHGNVRIVIAPHEPTESHLASLERGCAHHALRSVRLARFEAGDDAPVILVDRVGVLADLYAAAHAAFVGGGFGRAGLHSVVEPAALGVPVAFGGAVGNAREALDLAAAGGGVVIRDAAALAGTLRTWLNDADARVRAANAAAGFVAARLGGARRNAELLVSLLE